MYLLSLLFLFLLMLLGSPSALTRRLLGALAMINRPPVQRLQTTADKGRTVPLPQCVCANCFSPLMLPRPDATGTPFQCPQCRMAGVDMKVLYTRRAFPAEHSTN
ncbi:hypothetical protein TraAM80_05908 [Trypanosoma rangeli]|uniref:Uncharacterized protein n=1 Tax=Trypanosoma rangeli TaxID=5698 RepID=A0A3R7MC89_TRYRA|nr:uncharacterized protein TraAM80_05908 [Trypanosoma rangeli]RNF03175.1 hypothetical protein TraAM80_05908 [Trypanosoma rangeli]|eukprot:RNF03175.1 hypothetical protein TraAM80_05908 [Trypanosoma rangeli]